MANPTLPQPPVNREAEPFFEATSEGRFLLKRSVATKRAHWYPRSHCPFDGGATEWFEASGKGTIYSFTMIPGAQPYVVAYVALEEGPTLLTNIADCDPSQLAIGDQVRVIFEPAGELTVPCFAPVCNAAPT